MTTIYTKGWSSIHQLSGSWTYPDMEKWHQLPTVMMIIGNSFSGWFKAWRMAFFYSWPASRWRFSDWRCRIRSEYRSRTQPGPERPWSPGNRLEKDSWHMNKALSGSKTMHLFMSVKRLCIRCHHQIWRVKRCSPARRPRPPFPKPASSSMSSSSSMSRPNCGGQQNHLGQIPF